MSPILSLRSALFWRFILAASIPLLVVGYFSFTSMKKKTTALIESNATLLAHLATDEINNTIRKPLVLLQQAGGLVPAADERSTTAILDQTVEKSHLFQSIHLIDRGGRVAAIGLPASNRTGRKTMPELGPHTQSRFPEGIHKGRPTWSEPYLSPADGRRSLSLAVPAADGLLIGSFSLDRLQASVEKIRTIGNTDALLIGSDGSLIIHSGPAHSRWPLSLRDLPPVRGAIQGRFGTFMYERQDGREHIGSISRIEETGWFVLVSQPLEAAYTPILDLRQLFYAGLCFSLLAAVLISIVLAGSLTHPLSILQEKARQIAEGDYETVIPPLRYREHETVARGFRRMLTSIRERQEMVLASRRHYQTLFNSGSDAIFVARLEESGELGPFHDVNDMACRWLDYPREELKRLKPEEIDEGVWRNPEILEPVLNTLRHTGEALFETNLKGRSGQLIPVEINARIIDLDGEFAVQAVARNISERKKAEQQLRKFVLAIEQSPVSIVITDAEGTIEYVNPRFCSLTGFSESELIGKNPRLLRSGQTPAEVYRELWATIKGGADWRGEMCNRKKNGELFWESAIISPVKDADGNITHFIGIKEDVTGIRALENQLRHSQKMEALGTLTGGIAHDFNNILTAIVGHASLLQMKEGDALSRNGHIQQILTAADRASMLTRSLLTFSRKQAFEPKPLDLNELVERSGKLLERLIREDIDMRFAPGDLPLSVIADDGQIEQVLMNLITNARDAMPHGGILSIRTRLVHLDSAFIQAHGFGTPGGYALLEVSDTGIGMDEAVRQRIFEPFFTTKETGKGTGLGLAIVYGIVKQHSGYINCYSEPGKGTTFRIYLPAVPTRVCELQPPRDERLSAGTETILLAEDDTMVRQVNKALLEQAGYHVIEAADGNEAIETYKAHLSGIGLLIIDAIMPGKNGWEVYSELSRLHPGIRVLLTSGYTAEILETDELREKKLDFMTKPLAPTPFLSKVREILDRESACLLQPPC